jgi:hypothetical protein
MVAVHYGRLEVVHFLHFCGARIHAVSNVSVLSVFIMYSGSKKKQYLNLLSITERSERVDGCGTERQS